MRVGIIECYFLRTLSIYLGLSESFFKVFSPKVIASKLTNHVPTKQIPKKCHRTFCTDIQTDNEIVQGGREEGRKNWMNGMLSLAKQRCFLSCSEKK